MVRIGHVKRDRAYDQVARLLKAWIHWGVSLDQMNMWIEALVDQPSEVRALKRLRVLMEELAKEASQEI